MQAFLIICIEQDINVVNANAIVQKMNFIDFILVL